MKPERWSRWNEIRDGTVANCLRRIQVPCEPSAAVYEADCKRSVDMAFPTPGSALYHHCYYVRRYGHFRVGMRGINSISSGVGPVFDLNRTACRAAGESRVCLQNRRNSKWPLGQH